MDQHRTLIAWLNDAHAMEQNLLQNLQAQSNAFRDPLIRARIDDHIQETRRHALLVRECIERLGGTVSTIKSAAGTVSGFFQAWVGAIPDDGAVKALLADYAMEHLEIASYRSLVAAAEAVGAAEVAQMCEHILMDEERMALWLEQQIASVTQQYILSRSMAQV